MQVFLSSKVMTKQSTTDMMATLLHGDSKHLSKVFQGKFIWVLVI